MVGPSTVSTTFDEGLTTNCGIACRGVASGTPLSSAVDSATQCGPGVVRLIFDRGRTTHSPSTALQVVKSQGPSRNRLREEPQHGEHIIEPLNSKPLNRSHPPTYMMIDPSYVGRWMKTSYYELTISSDTCTSQSGQSQHCCILCFLLFSYISFYTGYQFEIASISDLRGVTELKPDWMNECEVIICDLSTITYKNVCTTYGTVTTRGMYDRVISCTQIPLVAVYQLSQ